jgi:ATP-dependent Clp protease ATP-binding subunit ClpA
LKRHGRDLTLEAAEGRLDPLVGREDVLSRTLQVGRGGRVVSAGRQAPRSLLQGKPPRLPHAGRRLLTQVLLRRTKNNPVLVGDPGVGKTAVAEGIAQLIASPAAPPGLAGRSLISLDVGSLVAGTQYRGSFEERLTVCGWVAVVVFVCGWVCVGGGGGGD